MVPKERRQRFDDHADKYMFIEYMTVIKQNCCFEPKTRREHFIRKVVFHESTPYYEKELRRTTLSSVPDDEKSSEFESKKEPIAGAPK